MTLGQEKCNKCVYLKKFLDPSKNVRKRSRLSYETLAQNEGSKKERIRSALLMKGNHFCLLGSNLKHIAIINKATRVKGNIMFL